MMTIKTHSNVTARPAGKGLATMGAKTGIILLLFLASSASSSMPVMAEERVVAPKEIVAAPLQAAEEIAIEPDASNGSHSQAEDKNTDASTIPNHIHVIRTIENLWYYEVKDEHVPNLAIKYSVTGANGKTGVFSNAEDPSSAIIVEIRPKGIESVEYVNDHWMMSEGVDLVLDPIQAGRPGEYTGIITAWITRSNI